MKPMLLAQLETGVWDGGEDERKVGSGEAVTVMVSDMGASLENLLHSVAPVQPRT